MNENNEVFSMEDEPDCHRDTEYAQRLQMALRIFGKLPSATGRGTLPDGQGGGGNAPGKPPHLCRSIATTGCCPLSFWQVRCFIPNRDCVNC